MKRILRLGTRSRALFSSFVIAAIFFFITSPLTTTIRDFVFAPDNIQNVKVIQKSGEIEIDFKEAESESRDVIKVEIYVDDTLNQSIENINQSTVISSLTNGQQYNIRIVTVDTSGKSSEGLKAIVSPSQKVSSFTLNQVDGSERKVFNILVFSVIFVIILTVLNYWVLFFNVAGYKGGVVSIALYPGISFVCFEVLSLSVYYTIGSDVNKFIFSIISSVASFFFVYFMILTSNILNGSLQMSLPLAQAAKAVQFIFGLLSTYLMIIFAIGSNFNLPIKMLLILPFVFYFSFTCMWFLKGQTLYQTILKSLTITLIVGLSLIIISIWPIDGVYSILFLAVVFYILLNISLEIREKLGRYYWAEYILLISLLVILIFTTGVWGINGTLI